MEVVAITGWTLREIFRHIEAGELHVIEPTAAELHICPNTLPLNARAEAEVAGPLCKTGTRKDFEE